MPATDRSAERTSAPPESPGAHQARRLIPRTALLAGAALVGATVGLLHAYSGASHSKHGSGAVELLPDARPARFSLPPGYSPPAAPSPTLLGSEVAVPVLLPSPTSRLALASRNGGSGSTTRDGSVLGHPAPVRPRPVHVRTTRPVSATAATTVAAPASGCAAALAYLAGHEAPGFTAYCPHTAFGHQAATCVDDAAAGCAGQRSIYIADACPAAYMNEASNSFVLTGLRSAPIDPYGYCGEPGNPNG